MKYVVANENTLGYIPSQRSYHSSWVNVFIWKTKEKGLEEFNRSGGYRCFNYDEIREATIEDFNNFNVTIPPDFKD